jgi:hypothetical protein
MDMNDIDCSLHEIEQMLLFALKAQDSFLGGDTARHGFFQIPAEDAELLSFSVHDLLKRVRALRADIYPPERAEARVLTLVRGTPAPQIGRDTS